MPSLMDDGSDMFYDVEENKNSSTRPISDISSIRLLMCTSDNSAADELADRIRQRASRTLLSKNAMLDIKVMNQAKNNTQATIGQHYGRETT